MFFRLTDCLFFASTDFDNKSNVVPFVFALQLLDQMEGSGPPPADARQIESLPTVKIGQDDVGTLSKILTCLTRSNRERDA